MLEKIKEHKKIVIMAILLLIITMIGVIIGITSKTKVEDKKVTLTLEEKINKIAEDSGYKISNISNKKINDNEELSFDIISTESNFEELSKKIYDYAKETNIDKIKFKVFSDEESMKKYEVFYTKGIVNDVEIDVTNKRTKIGTFEEVPNTEKASTLVSYNKGTIKEESGNVIISMDMALENDNPSDVIAQAKAFAILFMDTNPDKEIKSVELHLNSNGKEKLYNFNSLYENILEKIQIINY